MDNPVEQKSLDNGNHRILRKEKSFYSIQITDCNVKGSVRGVRRLWQLFKRETKLRHKYGKYEIRSRTIWKV